MARRAGHGFRDRAGHGRGQKQRCQKGKHATYDPLGPTLRLAFPLNYAGLVHVHGIWNLTGGQKAAATKVAVVSSFYTGITSIWRTQNRPQS